MKIVTVVGARPQFIKAAVVSRVIRDDYAGKKEEALVDTGIDTTCLASGNSGSKTNTRVQIVSSPNADFVPSHLYDQVDLDSENWSHSAKPCEGLAQRGVQLHESFRGNIGAKP